MQAQDFSHLPIVEPAFLRMNESRQGHHTGIHDATRFESQH
jgi:hypothetical protein